MNGNAIMLFPLLFPLIAGIIIGFQKQEKQRNLLVFITIAIELAVVVYLAGGSNTLVVWQMTDRLSLAYHTDGLAKFFAVMICAIWLLAAVFSFEYMKHEHKPARFFMFYTMALGALMSLCFSSNMVTLYLSYEYMTLLTLPLVIHTGTVEAVRAGMKYLGYSVFGAGLGLMGLFFLNSYCTSTSFVPGGTLDQGLLGGNGSLMLLIYFLMMIGFGCKAGMFPLHAWLPTAHPVAPSPASAVLSGIITKGGVIAIIRVTFYLVGADFIRGSWVQTALLTLAIITVFMGSMLAYKERLLKRRLAYSTVSQVSYVLFGLMTLHPIGFVGALMQVVFHAVAKNILFLGAGAIIYKTEKTYVDQYKGLGKQMPVVMWCFTIASLSLIGIPPTGGFVSKWYLAQAGLDPAYGTLGLVGVAVLMVSALLTAGYLLPIVIDAFFPGKDFDDTKLEKKEPNYLMTVPLVLLSAAVLAFGIFPGGLMQWILNISSVIF
ncbi:proton-conducting membrane transporter [Anaerotignum lactatifermentans]|uniref:Proton-conducting membrane transporter n=1 Tax=Anaerotignum lactatifermentans TaxID=160404 RepID=A0ABS2GAE7_9FIRM|nr:proton-conducting transporter membrane subunit [Anaerotignum lactatifermentans]MBM6828323.1 proton-conducting membrane transporter [Anaerotignum lactatifermentans]MBM6877603.1 proton-conducting membrane transporter [Anaerotignum lactatifermentans]MBM6949906.1 proton-conducting membrane transporter [Anaerotignum lactatifermentans]